MDECTDAFEKVNYGLLHALVLRMTKSSKLFEVVVDALKYALGGVLI